MARVPGLRSVIETERGSVRRVQSAAAPACPKCGNNEHVVRFWHGDKKMWACGKHFQVTSTKRKDASLAQRVLHRLPEPDTFSLDEVLTNRAARRRRR